MRLAEPFASIQMKEGPKMKLSPPRDEADRACRAGQSEEAADAPRSPQPARPDRPPSGMPEKPTDKPLPDLPNPTEVGEDG